LAAAVAAAALPAPPPSPGGVTGRAARKAEAKQQQQSAQSVAYQRMLEEFGLDAEAATFARQLVAKQAPRQQQQHAAALPSPATKQQQVAPPAVKAGMANVVVVPVTVKRPASAPATSGAGACGVAGSGTAGSDAALTKPLGARELMRIVGYYGDWICFCSEVNKLWDTCQCGQQAPCR
jgi:hypothetical protein